MKNMTYQLTAKIVFSVLLVALASACGSKGESGASTPTPVNPCQGVPDGGVGTNGQLCQFGQPIPNQVGGGNLLNNVQFETSHMRGAMSLIGNGNFDWNNPQIYATYSGTIAVNGTLQILDQSYCGAPAGVYTLTSNGVLPSGQAYAGQFLPNGSGAYMSGVISGLSIRATGPAAIQFIGSWLPSEVYNPQGLSRDASGNRIGLNVQMFVNGNPCGSVSTF